MTTLGQKVRQARRAKELTLAQLAKETDFSFSYISQVERGIINPSVSALQKLARVLDLPPSDLLDEPVETSVVSIVRKGNRWRYRYPGNEIDGELLTNGLRGKPFQFTWYTMPVGSTSGTTLIVHEGVECGFVIKGTLEVTVGNETFTLHEGDTAYFPSSMPHSWRNIGDVDVYAVWVGCPPSL
jgi:transcriptional regulator with XRE-family HTH domain